MEQNQYNQNQNANTGLQNFQPANLNKSQSYQPFVQNTNSQSNQMNYNQAYQIPSNVLNNSSTIAQPYQMPQNQQVQNQQDSQQYTYQFSQIVPNSSQQQQQQTQKIPQVNAPGYQQVQNVGPLIPQYTFQNQPVQNSVPLYQVGNQFTLPTQDISQQTQQTQQIPQIANQPIGQNINQVNQKPTYFDINQPQNVNQIPQMSNQPGLQQDFKPQLQGQSAFQIQKEQVNPQPFYSNTMQQDQFIPQVNYNIQQQQGMQNQPQSQTTQYNFNKSQSSIQVPQQLQQNTQKINELSAPQNIQGQNTGLQFQNYQPQQQAQQIYNSIPQQVNQFNSPITMNQNNPSFQPLSSQNIQQQNQPAIQFQYIQSAYNVAQTQNQTSQMQPQTSQINNPQQGQEIQIKGFQQQPNQVQNTGNQSIIQAQTQAMKQFFDQTIINLRNQLDQKLIQFKSDLQSISKGSNQEQKKQELGKSLDQTLQNIKQKLNDYIKEIGKDEDIVRIIALNIYNPQFITLKQKLAQLQTLQQDLSSQKYQKYIEESNQLDIQAKIQDVQLPKNATKAVKNTTVQLKIFFQNKSLIQIQGNMVGIQVANHLQKALHKAVKSGETVSMDYSLEIQQQIGQAQFEIQLVNLKNNKLLDQYQKTIEVIEMPQIQIKDFKQREFIGQNLQGGQQIKLQWVIQNIGQQKWPEGVVLISEQSHLTNFQEQKIHQLERNQQMFIPVDLKIPKDPGNYDISWDFQWQEQSLGEKLKFNFQVPNPNQIQEGKIPQSIIQKHQLTLEEQQIMINCLEMVGQYNMDRLAQKVKLYKEDQLVAELFKSDA